MNHLFLIVGPSGTGKTTLARGLAKNGVPEVVSHTSRPPREGEKEGTDYHFVSVAEFDSLVKSGAMLEHVEYGGNHYGSAALSVANAIEHGPACLIVDPNGASQIKSAIGKAAVAILLIPPPAEELQRRMLARGDDPAAARGRLELVRAEFDAGTALADFAIPAALAPEGVLSEVLGIIDSAL